GTFGQDFEPAAWNRENTDCHALGCLHTGQQHYGREMGADTPYTRASSLNSDDLDGRSVRSTDRAACPAKPSIDQAFPAGKSEPAPDCGPYRNRSVPGPLHG